MDDQLEPIIKVHQGTLSNEDFINVLQKEIKVYEKHGGKFLWGTTQDELRDKRYDEIKKKHYDNTGVAYTADEEKEQRKLITKAIQEEIIAMA